MSHNVNVDIFDTNSIENALLQIDKFKEELERKAEEVVKETAEESAKLYNMKVASAMANTQGDAQRASATSTKVDKSTYKVLASGGDELFLEFGTGITKADSPSARAEITVNGGLVNHGEYGKKLGANPEGWRDPYRKRWTKGFDAQVPMYSTKKQVKEIFKEKAKEKFK